MSVSSFAKILTILNLFSIDRPMINVDVICLELAISKPMAYRYLKELVEAGLLKKATDNVGDYVLGPKVAVLDYISRTTDPMIQACVPFMQEVVQRTEMICLLTELDDQHCIDIHHETLQYNEILMYGRGCPRALSAGSSAKIILAHLSKKQQQKYYHFLADELKKNNFAHDENEFIQQIRQIKKQGYYVSKGELSPDFSSLSVPLRFSVKDAPWALTVVASSRRFELMDTQKIVDVLKPIAQLIEQKMLQNQNEAGL